MLLINTPTSSILLVLDNGSIKESQKFDFLLRKIKIKNEYISYYNK